MRAEIVAVGTELLLGQIANTDAQMLSRWLAELGIDVFHHVTVGDNLERATAALVEAGRRADIVITSGGLGPTYDDITRDAIAEASGRPLVLNEDALRQVEAWFQARGLPWTDVNRRQALIPEGADVLPNRRGTAPGFWVPGSPQYIALPGPPRELEAVFQDSVRERLAAQSGQVLVSRIVKVAGLGESYLEPKLIDLYRGTSPTVAPYAKFGEVHLRVTAKAATRAEGEAIVAPVAAEIRRRLGAYVYGEGEEATLAGAILARLAAQGGTVAVAESATGGLLADAFARVPGASAVFRGGVVVYQDVAKERLLGVPAALLSARGAVSGQMAEELARRVRAELDTTFALATVGWAGPEGEDVGLTYHALADEHDVKVVERRFLGSREDIRQRLVQASLVTLWQTLNEDETG